MKKSLYFVTHCNVFRKWGIALIARKYGLGNGKINIQSDFNSAIVRTRDELLKTGNGTIKNEIEDWETTDKTTYDFYVCDSLVSSVYANTFQYEGLVNEFSKIKTIDDVGNFANKYGLLGLSHPCPKSTWPEQDGYTLDEFHESDEVSRYGLSELTVEPIEFWLNNANSIRKLMKVYRMLRRYKNGGAVNFEDLISFEPWDKGSSFYTVYWYDGERTSLFFHEDELNSHTLVDIYKKLLIKSVLAFMNNGIGIKITPNIIESSKAPLGFYVSEIPTANSLLTAIYYDLWKLLGEDVNIEICANDECKMPFIKNKRQKYCSNSCKQQAYRIRNEKAADKSC